MIIAATKNKHKLEEMEHILKKFNIQLQSIDAAGYSHVDVIEDGNTFEENSMKKAETIMQLSGKPVIADDSGLEVKALDGRPGVFSARYSGENATDQDNNKKLLSELEGQKDRSAKFVSVISLAFPDGKKISVRGECNGTIGYAEKGSNGFGYDPLFVADDYGKTFAELDSEIKNTISHRANALKKLKEVLDREKYFKEFIND